MMPPRSISAALLFSEVHKESGLLGKSHHTSCRGLYVDLFLVLPYQFVTKMTQSPEEEDGSVLCGGGEGSAPQ
jgi:hypothetical protein